MSNQTETRKGKTMRNAFPLGPGFGSKGKSLRARDRVIERSVRAAVEATGRARARETAAMVEAIRTRKEQRQARYEEWVASHSLDDIKAALERTAEGLDFTPEEKKDFVRQGMKQAKLAKAEAA